jgi:acyl-[acyl-carrier-protein]-phospholipid O-acyltransferase / long-chain-fatty-acid--[acyl-carrier-protein] ligase
MAKIEFDAAQSRISVFRALLQARKAKGGKTPILEDQDRNVLTYDAIVRAAFALGGRIAAITSPGERVGVLLPTGVGGAVTFFALHAYGRTPTMLNFTAGAMNLRSGCAAAGVKRVLTARRFVELGNLGPLVAEIATFADVIYLEDVREKLSIFDKLGALIKGFFPETFAPQANPDDAAVVLFTSGSFGAPRGVVLSHANLVSNVRQCYAHIPFDPDWVFFNPLPLFHCFGLTGGTLLPLLTGHRAFLYPSPLHFKDIPPLIQEVGANVLFATDTFAMQYARSAKHGELSCLKFTVLGAERVKEETREIFRSKFNVDLLEGYGATEASPVVAVNHPANNRIGTVGAILPGIEWRLEPVPGIERGAKLVIRGPNVMSGYLSADGVIEAPPDGWHDTGDIVDVDADGYVTILGRVKRFAKIGGETVSLNAVENYAAHVWPEHNHAAVSLPDPRKGERIVLFSDCQSAQPSELLAWAHANGAPEIAVPKKVIPLPQIPVLGTGKTDYASLQRMAEEQSAAAEAA